MITKILITVMTYPSLSTKYFETVCTAGFREDGTWIRIFPVPHRLLNAQQNKKYHKWQWIEVDLQKNSKDKRPESYHIVNIDTLKVLDRFEPSGKPLWGMRYDYVRKGKLIYKDMGRLIDLAHSNDLSLAVLKPKEILDVTVERIDIQPMQAKRKELEKEFKERQKQLELFPDQVDYAYNFKFAETIPYKFSYRFTTEDGKERKLLIEDWEIGMLYRNCMTQDKDEKVACEKVRKKYLDFAKRDLLFFVGTHFRWHMLKSPDPFLIIGVFSSPKGTFEQGRQLSLF